MVDSINEKRLLTELKNGSFQAFERLYNMYSGKLYNFIMRISSGNQYMAEEVVQSAFIRVWEVRERVEPESSFISFLCTIAKNLLMNMYQRQTVENDKMIFCDSLLSQFLLKFNQLRISLFPMELTKSP